MVEAIIRGIDRISEISGKTGAWLILIIAFSLGYEVLVRYAFNAPTTWAFDASYMLYGTYFMLASAYTLSRDGHVRGDIFYRNFSPRAQAMVDLALYILVFFPAMAALTVSGWRFFYASFLIRETSPLSPYATPVYPLKAIIPLGAVLLILQGIAQVLRCVRAIQTGRWP